MFKILVTQLSRSLGFERWLRLLIRKYKGASIHPLQSADLPQNLPLLRLGSFGCGWVIIDDKELYNSKIISAGLGEDISFEIDFITKYSASVIGVDPTPRAVRHYESVALRFGEANLCSYGYSGYQEPTSYNVATVDKQNFNLVTKALWNEDGAVKFFAPKNDRHVSHSIVNFQNSYSNDTPSIEVASCTISSLAKLAEIDLSCIKLLKLDVEGAEIEIIATLNELISKGFRPSQIALEFDEFNEPSSVGIGRIETAHNELCRLGYQIVHTDGNADFLYATEDLLCRIMKREIL